MIEAGGAAINGDTAASDELTGAVASPKTRRWSSVLCTGVLMEDELDNSVEIEVARDSLRFCTSTPTEPMSGAVVPLIVWVETEAEEVNEWWGEHRR
jgi:hypothetical protein